MFMHPYRLIGFCLVVGSSLAACTAPPPAPTPIAAWPTPYPTPLALRPVTRSADGYTVTLYPLYADPSRAVITYTVIGPLQPALAATWFGLIAHYDRQFQGPHAFVNGGLIDLPAQSLLPGRIDTDDTPLPANPDAQHIWVFDTGSLDPMPTALPLRISGDLFANLPPKYDSIWPVPQEQLLAEKLSFDVVLPVNPQHRLVLLQQSVYTADVTLTLEQVEVAASETRFYWHAEFPATHIDTNGRADTVELQIGEWQDQQEDRYEYPLHGLGNYLLNGRSWITLYPQALLQRQGDWTVTIPRLTWSSYDVARQVNGPWIFHFQVPPPSDASGPVTP